MLRPTDNFFLQHDEPAKSCLQFLRAHILGMDKSIAETWSYGMPFYLLDGKRFCYLWYHKKYKQPYIGFTDGKLLDDPALLAESRSRMKILLLNAAEDLPLEKIDQLLKQAIVLVK